MPTCTSCETPFPCWVEVAGKKRNVAKRRRCLDCQPFKSRVRYQSPAGAVAADRGMKHCPKCDTTKPLDDFYRKKMNADRGRFAYCKVCERARKAASAVALKTEAVAYKGGACCVCNYVRCLGALVFHHLDPAEKDFTFAQKSSFKKLNKTLKKELDKCILVCRNCHAEIHDGLHKLAGVAE